MRWSDTPTSVCAAIAINVNAIKSWQAIWETTPAGLISRDTFGLNVALHYLPCAVYTFAVTAALFIVQSWLIAASCWLCLCERALRCAGSMWENLHCLHIKRGVKPEQGNGNFFLIANTFYV